MKVCPRCDTGFPESYATCPTHGILLSEIRDLKTGMLIRSTYRIIRKVGEGGFGSVYLAEQTLMGEQRALKFLSHQMTLDEGFKARFRREVRTLRQVRHRNVVDCGDLEKAEDDTLFFAMEFVDGPDLRDYLNKAPRPFDVKLALAIARGIAEGLGAAHAKGMVHRDIKPENILMAWEDDRWIPKIADFGIVATKENSTTRATTGGGSLLTHAYAAPEQWRGIRSAELDGRTDIYALGGVLFEMLTGQTAFDAENYEGWAEQHRNVAPKSPSSLRPELARWKGLDALVLRMLAKDRDLRHKNVVEVIELLDAVRYVFPEEQRKIDADDARKRQETIVEMNRVRPTPVPAPPPMPRPQPIIQQPQPLPKKDAGIPGRVLGIIGLVLAVFVVVAIVVGNVAFKQNPSSLSKDAGDALSQGNYSKAQKLFTKSCDAGDAAGCNSLATLYRGGHGVEADVSHARDLFAKACDAGSANGCNNLGAVYEEIEGAESDDSQIVNFYEKACTLGNAEGCLNLGNHYRSGVGVKADVSEAKKFFQMSCDKGDQAGCNSLQALQAALDALNKFEDKGSSRTEDSSGTQKKLREEEARKLLEQ